MHGCVLSDCLQVEGHICGFSHLHCGSDNEFTGREVLEGAGGCHCLRLLLWD